MITCVPVTGGDTSAALVKMEEAFRLADMVELRLDRMADPDLSTLLNKGSDRIIATNRRKEEGGGFNGTERERVDLLRQAVRLGAGYVDIEAATDPDLLDRLRSDIALQGHRTLLIVSSHDFSGTPALTVLKGRMEACGAGDVAKIVTYARRIEDNLRLLNLIPYAHRKGRKIIAFCMGDLGRLSRVVAPLLGSFLTYAALRAGEESAPGQMTVEKAMAIYRELSLG
ncbi:MAG: type I 3-dehydroquinate dehydratase [Deltaproteobacteria bacterium]|nr:type I 3-dehydroquinate dehydratase [Deltaproteobacteria bacterium]